MLKHKGAAIVLQEVPDEISLAINITGCTHRCVGCHSPYLWEDDGEPVMSSLYYLIKPYLDYMTCVCLMGGDQDQNELTMLCKIIHADGFKTCLYTGCDHISDLIKPLLDELDYVKIGRYIQEKGPLNNPTTNQRMYRKDSNGAWVDITGRFWTKYAEKEEGSPA